MCETLDLRYKDPSLPVSERVRILLDQMTPEEKVAQIVGNGVMAGEFRDIKKDIPHGCGHINGTFLLGETSAEARAKTIEKIQRYMVEETRLGIPALFHMETTSGSFYTDAVVSPVAIAMGATFDRDTVGDMAQLIGRQNRAEGYTHAFGPVFDVGRDQRWGRLGETYVWPGRDRAGCLRILGRGPEERRSVPRNLLQRGGAGHLCQVLHGRRNLYRGVCQPCNLWR